MAIDAYVGKPGHGKTYGVVEHVIIPSLKQGRQIITNIPLKGGDLIRDFGGSVVQLPDDWFEVAELSELVPNGSVLVLDEVWRRWPKGQKSNQVNVSDKALLAEHRHRVDELGNSMRVVLVTQDLSQIAAWTYPLVETTYRVKKYGRLVYRLNVYDGCVTGDSPPKSRRIKQSPGKFSKHIFKYYISATQSKTGGVGDESTADARGSILRSWGLWAICLFVIVCGSFSYFGLRTFFNGPTKPDADSVNSAAAVSPASVVKSEIPLSSDWRIQGFVHGSGPVQIGKSIVVISNRSGKLRYISFSKCRYYDDFQEAYCIVDGAKVTTWSSSNSSFGSALLGDGVQRSVNTASQ